MISTVYRPAGVYTVMLLLNLSIFSGSVSAAEAITYKKHVAPNHPISLDAPEAWEEIENPDAIMLFAEPEGDYFRANFGVTVQPYDGKPPIEAFQEFLPKQLPQNVKKSKHGLRTVAGSKSYYIEASAIAEGVSVINVQYFIPKGGMMYMLTFMSAAEKFGNYSAILERVVSSISID